MGYNLLPEDSPSSTEPSVRENPHEQKSSSAFPPARHFGTVWPGSIILSLVISILVSTVTAWVYDAKFAQKVVAVDIKGYVAKQGDDYLAGKITEDQFRKAFDHLQKVVESIPPNKAVLMGDLVVRNVETVKP